MDASQASLSCARAHLLLECGAVATGRRFDLPVPSVRSVGLCVCVCTAPPRERSINQSLSIVWCRANVNFSVLRDILQRATSVRKKRGKKRCTALALHHLRKVMAGTE